MIAMHLKIHSRHWQLNSLPRVWCDLPCKPENLSTAMQSVFDLGTTGFASAQQNRLKNNKNNVKEMLHDFLK